MAPSKPVVAQVATRGRIIAVVAALVAVTAGLAIVALTKADDRTDDIEQRRAFYDAFPAYPNSVKVAEDEYEIKSDGRPTGEFGLSVVYRLPDGATSTAVSEFFRDSVPNGWAVADDESCAARIGGFAVPPPDPNWTGPTQPVVPPVDWVLTNERSRFTVLSPPGDNINSGITFALSREGRDKFVTLDRAGFSCAPTPTADAMAEQFDQP